MTSSNRSRSRQRSRARWRSRRSSRAPKFPAHTSHSRAVFPRATRSSRWEIAEDLHAKDETGRPLDRKALIFGHTDLSGGDVLNKELSERRAKAIFALFTHDDAKWEKLYSGKPSGTRWNEVWDVWEAQHMMNALGCSDKAGKPLKETGVRDQATREAIHRFQDGDYSDRPAEQAPLERSDFLGKDGRKEMFLAYAKRVSRNPVPKDRFVEANGTPFVGCGEFNPLSLTAKDAESRRAVVMVFDGAAGPSKPLPCKLGSVLPCNEVCSVAPLWHSFGMEAWEGAVDASPGVRKAFSAIRTKGTSSGAPISFHLDDAVLTSLTAPVTIRADQRRLGLYTALAGLHDPTQAGGKDVPYSKLQASVPMRAEAAMFRRGKGIEECTRFIDWEGELHEVSTQFATGITGTTPCVGARAADRATPIEDNAEAPVVGPDVTSGHRTYLFDTRWVRHTHQGVSARLAHLVCYVSVFIDGSQLNPANSDAVSVLETLLVESSKRWDQQHPGIAGSTSLKKDYVVIPATGFKADSTLLKVRHVFGSRSLVGTQAIIVQVDTQPGRATGGRTMRLYCRTGQVIAPPPNRAWLTANPGATIPGATIPVRPYEFEPSAVAGTAERLDGTTQPWFTFAHELGHESGLLDEYLERIPAATVSPNASEFLPRFDQFGIRARPYFLDTFGMMKQNELPRLRYIWNYVDAMHRNTTSFPAGHWFFEEAPFVAQYVAGSRTLTHAIPRDAASFATLRGGPWTATTGAQGLCNLSFYPTSHDEGMVGPAVLDSGLLASGDEFDGLLVIHPMIWVTFDAGITGADLGLRRWMTFAPWGTLYFSQTTTPHFAISTPSAPNAKRVVLVFQPRFEFGPNPTAGQTRANATLELHVTTGGVPPTLTAGAPPTLTVDENDVGAWILRYALVTQPAAVPRPNKNATRAADLTMLPLVLATMLGRPEVGTVVAYKAAP